MRAGYANCGIGTNSETPRQSRVRFASHNRWGAGAQDKSGPGSWLLCRAGSLHLDVDEDELEWVEVNDIMLDAGLAEIGLAGDQLGIARPAWFFEPQLAG